MADIRGLGIQGLYASLRASIRGALHVKHPPLRYIGQEQLTSAAATVYHLTVPATATYASIHVTAGPIYYDWAAGKTPSATQGDTMDVGGDVWAHGRGLLSNFGAVRQTSSNFTLKVLYFAEGDYDE